MCLCASVAAPVCYLSGSAVDDMLQMSVLTKMTLTLTLTLNPILTLALVLTLTLS